MSVCKHIKYSDNKRVTECTATKEECPKKMLKCEMSNFCWLRGAK
jgi:hypothetical protein